MMGWTGWLGGGSLIVLAVFALSAGNSIAPALPIGTRAVLLVTALAQGATSIVLLATIRMVRERSIALLAVVFAGACAFSLVSLVFLDGNAFSSAHPDQRLAWLYLSRHVLIAGATLIYAYLRRIDAVPAVRPWRVLAAFAVTGAVVVTGAIVAAQHAALAPPIVSGGLTSYRISALGPAVVALEALALIAVARRVRSALDRAVGFALLAALLGYVVSLAGTQPSGIAWHVALLLYVVAPVCVLTATVRTFIAAAYRLEATQASLAEQSERLAAVWKVATDASLIDETERFRAMLDAGARALGGPHQIFAGHVGHYDGDEIVVDAIVHQQGGEVNVAAAMPAGMRFPVEDGMHAAIRRAGASASWDDVARDPEHARRKRVQTFGLRATIGTTFCVGTVRYFVLFSSLEPARRPFAAEDRAFVDVLASFFAGRLQRRHALERIRFQAENDTLTGLGNRASFRLATNEALREDSSCALVVIDIDRFREVNDTLGHQTGDAVLVEIAAALRAHARDNDIIGRLGGDNFGVLLRDVTSPGDARLRIAALVSIFRTPFGTGDREGVERVRVSASAGVALYPADAATYEDLLSRADAAVDAAKAGGRGRTRYFDPGIGTSLVNRRALRKELVSALAAEEFCLHYQPVVSACGGQVMGAEALVRWNRPDHGLTGPDDFIPFAEANGLIDELGRWVLRRTLRDIAALGDYAGGLHVSINVSAGQLDDARFVSELRTLLRAYPSAATRLVIEITESAVMRDAAQAIRTLAEIRALGVRIALDDFGTGYSSLTYLKRLPLDIIKIDRSFVAGLPADERDAVLAETILSVARQFRYTTVAEGVETNDQREWLSARGCTMIQGFLIARPMPVDELRAWLGMRGERSADELHRYA